MAEANDNGEAGSATTARSRRITFRTETGLPVSLYIGTRFTDRETFTRRFAPMVGPGGMFVVTQSIRRVGDKLSFAVTLADESVMLEGEVEVLEVRTPDPRRPERKGMRLKFLQLSQKSRELVDAMVRVKRESGTRTDPNLAAEAQPERRVGSRTPAPEDEAEEDAAPGHRPTTRGMPIAGADPKAGEPASEQTTQIEMQAPAPPPVVATAAPLAADLPPSPEAQPSPIPATAPPPALAAPPPPSQSPPSSPPSPSPPSIISSPSQISALQASPPIPAEPEPSPDLTDPEPSLISTIPEFQQLPALRPSPPTPPPRPVADGARPLPAWLVPTKPAADVPAPTARPAPHPPSEAPSDQPPPVVATALAEATTGPLAGRVADQAPAPATGHAAPAPETAPEPAAQRERSSVPLSHGAAPNLPRAEARAPSSPHIVEANPLAEIDDDLLRGFIDETLLDGQRRRRKPSLVGFKPLAATVPPDTEPSDATTATGPAPSRAAVEAAPVPVSPATRILPVPPSGASLAAPTQPSLSAPTAVAQITQQSPAPRPAAPSTGPSTLFLAISATAALSLAAGIALALFVHASNAPSANIAPTVPAAEHPIEKIVAPAPPPPPAPAPAAPVLCTVDVRSEPPGALVRWNGEERGITPATLTNLACAREGELSVGGGHYRVWKKRVTPSADAPEPVQATLVAIPPRLIVWSKPAHATVILNGKRAGATPYVTEVKPAAEIKIEIEQPGFKPWSSTVFVRGQFTSVSPVLEPLAPR